MTDSVRRYGVRRIDIHWWRELQCTLEKCEPVYLAADYDQIAARLAASEAERDSMVSAKNKWIEQLAAERDSLRAKLAKLAEYAQHGYYCDLEVYKVTHNSGHPQQCTCGLAALQSSNNQPKVIP